MLVDELAKEKKSSEPATDKVLQEELDNFLKLKINHDHVFRGYKPSIDLWRDMRSHYGVFLGDETEELADATKTQWFNRPIITLYMRNVSEASPIDLKEYNDLFLDSVPGNNFENTHMQIDHLDTEMCPQDISDIFAHPNATSFLALLEPSASKFKEAEAAAKQFEDELQREENQDDRQVDNTNEEEPEDEEAVDGPGDPDSQANHGDDEDEDVDDAEHDNEDRDELPEYENVEDLNDDEEGEEHDENAAPEDIQRAELINDLYDAADKQEELDDKAAGYYVFENNEGLEPAPGGDEEEESEEDGGGDSSKHEEEEPDHDHDKEEMEYGKHDEL